MSSPLLTLCNEEPTPIPKWDLENVQSSFVGADVEVAVFGDGAIDFHGVKYQPDDTKGYFGFKVSHSFPTTTYYGTALHPHVIGMSFKSLLNQNLNYEHQIRAYHKERGDKNYVEDRIIGSIVAVDFPKSTGTMRATKDSVPIEGVAVFYKMATAMQKVIGEHQTGRHRYTVSMEVSYPVDEAGFVVAMNGGKSEFKSQANDLAEIGFDYVPWNDAPEDLRATFSKQRNRIVKKYRNRATYLLMGGLANPVHYAGLGVVRYGAEATAEITRMAASDDDPIVSPFRNLADLLSQCLEERC